MIDPVRLLGFVRLTRAADRTPSATPCPGAAHADRSVPDVRNACKGTPFAGAVWRSPESRPTAARSTSAAICSSGRPRPRAALDQPVRQAQLPSSRVGEHIDEDKLRGERATAAPR